MLGLGPYTSYIWVCATYYCPFSILVRPQIPYTHPSLSVRPPWATFVILRFLLKWWVKGDQTRPWLTTRDHRRKERKRRCARIKKKKKDVLENFHWGSWDNWTPFKMEGWYLVWRLTFPSLPTDSHGTQHHSNMGNQICMFWCNRGRLRDLYSSLLRLLGLKVFPIICGPQEAPITNNCWGA